MGLVCIVPPVDDVVSLERAKQHLHVDSAHDDAKIVDLIAAATRWLDGDMGVLGRCLTPQTWELTLCSFPAYAIELPLPPAIEVVSVTYLDPDGGEQTVSVDDYRFVAGGERPSHVVPRPTVIWPQTSGEPDAVRVRFRAGYAPGATQIEPLRRAMLMMVERWYDEQGGDDVPPAVDGLISSFRLCPL